MCLFIFDVKIQKTHISALDARFYIKKHVFAKIWSSVRQVYKKKFSDYASWMRISSSIFESVGLYPSVIHIRSIKRGGGREQA